MGEGLAETVRFRDGFPGYQVFGAFNFVGDAGSGWESQAADRRAIRGGAVFDKIGREEIAGENGDDRELAERDESGKTFHWNILPKQIQRAIIKRHLVRFQYRGRGHTRRLSVPPRFIFGQNVNRLRQSRGMTQEQLSEKVEIDRRYLQRIEKGTANPGVDVINRLKMALDAEWTELLDGR